MKAYTVTVIAAAAAAACGTHAGRTDVVTHPGDPGAKPVELPAISDDGRVAAMYEVGVPEAPRVGLAVIDAASDTLTADARPAVPRSDEAAIGAMRSSAKALLLRPGWRSMVAADKPIAEADRSGEQWTGLGLRALVHQASGVLAVEDLVSGETFDVPMASRLVKNRGCELSTSDVTLILTDAAYDPRTRWLWLSLDAVPAAEAHPFTCDPSVLVHVIKLPEPKRARR